jgi:RNA polymerase sigma-70 factor, ECF subfamily
VPDCFQPNFVMLEFGMRPSYNGAVEMSATQIEAGASLPISLPEQLGVAPIDEMMPEVYEDLRRLAASYLRGERVEHTLQGTALVHEAYLRFINDGPVEWKNRAHLIGIFARLMRQTLINHAVAKHRLKRGGEDRFQLTLQFYESRKVDVRVLDEALHELEILDSRQAQIVELRFFAGLTIEEIADVLAISPATVKRDWTVAKVWLRHALSTSG